MFNVGLTYKITDWINLAARYRMDDTYVKFERKIYASSDQVLQKVLKDITNIAITMTVRNMLTSW